MTQTSGRRAGIAAAVLAGLVGAEVVTAVVAGALSGMSLAALDQALVVTNTVIGLSLAVAGWPIAAHRPRNPIGWLLLGAGLAYATTGAGMPLLRCVADAGGANEPFWRAVATVVSGGWTLGLMALVPLALLCFPDGRLPSRRWRWLLGAVALSGGLWFARGVGSGVSATVGVPGYLVFAPGPEADEGALAAVSSLAVGVVFVALVPAVVLRFRRGADVVRRQLLWLMLAVLVVVVVFVLDPVLPDSDLTILPITLIPLSILVAVLRHQLLDIRVVFSRSLAYVLLTGAGVGVYLGVVALLGHVLTARVALGPSVVATLVVAMAFNPVRVWLQRRIDRAVYGARQDPVRAIAEVGATVAGPGLDAVLPALCRVLRFPSAAIVHRGTTLASWGDGAGGLHAVPLHHGDERLGELVVGLRYGESRLAAADERVLTLLAAPIAVAVHATALAAELARSREQTISGREEERRRLRRDLHDGLGPVLTGVALNAEAALRLVRSAPERSEQLIGELRDQTTRALGDIRRLVYDLRPPALDSLGLVGALHEYAVVVSRRVDSTPLTVTLDAPEHVGDLPAAVEVAAYRIVTEALTNVTRHSNARAAVVRLAVEGGELHVAVHDDGVNVTGGWQPGVGLTSIRERAAELGGRCTIQLDRTGGRVDVHLPVLVTTAVTA